MFWTFFNWLVVRLHKCRSGRTPTAAVSFREAEEGCVVIVEFERDDDLNSIFASLSSVPGVERLRRMIREETPEFIIPRAPRYQLTFGMQQERAILTQGQICDALRVCGFRLL